MPQTLVLEWILLICLVLLPLVTLILVVILLFKAASKLNTCSAVLNVLKESEETRYRLLGDVNKELRALNESVNGFARVKEYAASLVPDSSAATVNEFSPENVAKPIEMVMGTASHSQVLDERASLDAGIPLYSDLCTERAEPQIKKTIRRRQSNSK